MEVFLHFLDSVFQLFSQVQTHTYRANIGRSPLPLKVCSCLIEGNTKHAHTHKQNS